MRKTPLYNRHLALGAKIVPFAGFEMPVQYDGVVKEHLAVRQNTGVFDISHMGEFWVRGPKAIDLLQQVFSNDVSNLTVGQAQYGYFPNSSGGIIDDLLVYRTQEEEYMLVVNAANIAKDWNWLVTHNTVYGATLDNESDNIGLLALQGPKAATVLATLTDVDISNIPFYHFTHGTVAGIEKILISATGYTGSGGFELYIPTTSLWTVWDTLIEKGVTPCGLAARNTLRIEMGYCLYGNDIDDTTSPMAAGLAWCTKFTKNFVNSKNLALQKKEKTTHRRVGFVLTERGIPRKGYSLVDADGNAIGLVTSGTQSPSLGKGIGMGYVKREQAAAGKTIYVEIRNKRIQATITSFPFYHA